LLYAALLAFCAYFIKNPAPCADAVSEALTLCAATLVPALFPFTVMTGLAVSCGMADALGRRLDGFFRTVFHINGACGAAVLFGMISGFPCGAAFAAKLYKSGRCSADEAERCAAFANNAGAAFVIGAAGGVMFGDIYVGVRLYAAQLISAAICGVLLGIGHRATNVSAAAVSVEPTFSSALSSAVRDGALAMLYVCGFVCFFAVLTSFLANAMGAVGIPDGVTAIICGFCEFTRGTAGAAAAGGGCGQLLAAAYIGWSGLCVHAQTAQLLSDAGLRTGRYAASKALQAALCAVIMWVLNALCGV